MRNLLPVINLTTVSDWLCSSRFRRPTRLREILQSTVTELAKSRGPRVRKVPNTVCHKKSTPVGPRHKNPDGLIRTIVQARPAAQIDLVVLAWCRVVVIMRTADEEHSPKYGPADPRKPCRSYRSCSSQITPDMPCQQL